MNSEILYITRKLGFPSSYGLRSGLGDFLEQYPDGIYAETGIGAPIGWESAAVWFGGASEQAAARFERMVAERNDVSRLFRTRVAGTLVITFLYRLKRRGVTAIPVGGGAEPGPSPIDEWWGLKLTMPEGGTVILRKNGSPNAVSLEVSTDAVNWTEWELVGTDYTYTLQADETLCIRNTSTGNPRFSISSGDYWKFILSSTTYASGDIMSLVSNIEGVTSLNDEWFIFAYLFENQSNLKTMPELTPTQLSTRCYYSAFKGTGITETTTLPASVLENYCYGQIFAFCNDLKVVRTKMTDVSASNCLTNWLNGVAATGDFYCPSSLTIPTGSSGIPNGWTRHDI